VAASANILFVGITPTPILVLRVEQIFCAAPDERVAPAQTERSQSIEQFTQYLGILSLTSAGNISFQESKLVRQ
jgi:hypothetical protein